MDYSFSLNVFDTPQMENNSGDIMCYNSLVILYKSIFSWKNDIIGLAYFSLFFSLLSKYLLYYLKDSKVCQL